MSSEPAKLNLRPFERRLVVAVGIVVFLVVQFLYIWPHFGDVQKMDLRRNKGLDTLKMYKAEIAQTNTYVRELKEMEGQAGAVPPEDQAVELSRTIQSQAQQTGVLISANSKPNTRTNEFFLELTQQITTASDEPSLLEFLYNLGEGNSLIRVRDLTLRRDPSLTKLSATVRLVASYQKKPALRSTPPASKGEPKAPASAAAAPKPVVPNPAAPKPSTPNRKKP